MNGMWGSIYNYLGVGLLADHILTTALFLFPFTIPSFPIVKCLRGSWKLLGPRTENCLVPVGSDRGVLDSSPNPIWSLNTKRSDSEYKPAFLGTLLALVLTFLVAALFLAVYNRCCSLLRCSGLAVLQHVSGGQIHNLGAARWMLSPSSSTLCLSTRRNHLCVRTLTYTKASAGECVEKWSHEYCWQGIERKGSP